MDAFKLMKLIRLGVCTVVVAGWMSAGYAQEEGTEAKAPPEPLTEEQKAGLDAQLADIAERRSVNRSLERLYDKSDPMMKEVVGMRLAQSWSTAVNESLEFAQTVAGIRDSGQDVSNYSAKVVEQLRQHPVLLKKAEAAIESRMVAPDPDASIEDKATATTRLIKMVEVRDDLSDVFFKTLKWSRNFGLDVTAVEQEFGDALEDRAANNSALLSIAMEDAQGRRQALSMIPGDPDITASLALSQSQIASLAQALRTTVGMLNRLGRDTAGYREQIISATGEISTDIFDPAVLFGLLRSWGGGVLDAVTEHGPNLLLKLLIFLGIVIVFRRLSKVVRNLVEKGLERSKVQPSQLLSQMILSLCGNVVMIIGVLIGLSQIGIALGPLLAGLGVAGFVIGFALQDTLSNFASGMMILTYRPFDVGDVVEAGGVFGTVSHMSLVNTTVMTFDNQTNVVPNNKIWGDVIKNVTSQRTRRIDLVFGISYDDDIEKTEKVLHSIIEAEERILKRPEAMIHLHELADSSVNFIVRPWVRTKDYWDVYWAITRTVKLRFDAENISIPYPQSDVHVDISKMPG